MRYTNARLQDKVTFYETISRFDTLASFSESTFSSKQKGTSTTGRVIIPGGLL